MSISSAVKVTLYRRADSGALEQYDGMHVVALDGLEGVSQLFEIGVTIYHDGQDVDTSALGQPLALKLEWAEDRVRFIDGIVGAWTYRETIRDRTQQPVHVYQATLVPKVWKMLHRSDCRVFYRKDLLQIIEQVFTTHGQLAAGEFCVDFAMGQDRQQRQPWTEVIQRHPELSWIGGPRDEQGFRVQYRESDWSFLSRLLEEFGIFYYFEHTESGHVLHLGNAPRDYLDCSPASLTHEVDVSPFHFTETVCPTAVVLKDFNQARPSYPLEQLTGQEGQLTLYDYPGGFMEDRQREGLPRVRLQEARAPAWLGQGQSGCVGLTPGHVFTLDGCQHNPALDQGYMVLRVHHRAVNSDPEARYKEHSLQYDNSFQCIPRSLPFRPPRVTPRPSVRGVQTAIVQGPTRGEPHLDPSGRVKIRFHWSLNDQDFCWVRVSQSFGMRPDADPVRGGMWWPRAGDEVVVDFVEGDPDRPLVVGTVYATSHEDGVIYSPHGATETQTLNVLKKGHDDETKIWTKDNDDGGKSPEPKLASSLDTNFPPYVMDASGKDLTLSNPHRNVIKDGANEISLHDDGTTRALLVQARHGKKDANLLTDADYHHDKSDKYYQDVKDEYRQKIGGGGLKRYVKGVYHMVTGDDHRVEVGGNVYSYIGGNTYLTGDQKTYNWGPTKDYHYADSFSEHHGMETGHHYGISNSIHIGSEHSLFLGGKASFAICAVAEFELSGGLHVNIGLLNLELNVDLLKADFNFNVLTLSMTTGIRVELDYGIKVERGSFEAVKVEGSLVDKPLNLKSHIVSLKKHQALIKKSDVEVVS